MLPKFLIEHVTDFKWGFGRDKSHGAMWGGEARACIGEVEFNLKLWHHGNDEETTERLLPHLCIDAVIWQGKYHDVYWYCLFDDTQLWIHPTGWFEDAELRSKVSQSNPNLGSRIMPVEKMLALGFVKIVG